MYETDAYVLGTWADRPLLMGLNDFFSGSGGTMISSGASMAFNASQAKKARAWTRRQYGRRYQQTVRDMRKAGINPILAAGMGLGGGGSPSGSAASVSAPDLGQSASQAKGQTTARRLLEEGQVHVMRTQARKNQAEAVLADTKRMVEEALLPGVRIEAEIDSSAYGRAVRYGNRGIPMASALLKAIPIPRLFGGTAKSLKTSARKTGQPRLNRGQRKQASKSKSWEKLSAKERFEFESRISGNLKKWSAE